MSRFKPIVAVALSVALVGGLAVSLVSGDDRPAHPAEGLSSEFFGIIQGIRLDQEDFQTMEETGVRSNRFLVLWGSVEPSPGSYEWGPTDGLIGAFASHGIRAVPFLWGSPPWIADTNAQPPLDEPDDLQAWQDFLKAVVGRYGRGGIYWAKEYRQRYGPDAQPLPVQSWQVWNEPNLSKYFAPEPSAERYAELLRASGAAIRSQDPEAQIVLAGMPGYGEVNAWEFLDDLYAVPEVKDDFDAAALHPYAPNLDQLRQEIEQVRKVMAKHGDRRTPLWLTEMGWGSAPPDRFGLNKGINGQKRLLSTSFELILRRRQPWNIGRLFWFDWRDPIDPGQVKCSFCASAGLLRADRTPKPAYRAFKRFVGGR